MTGPGSFTAVRIGVALANTWGLVNKTQVIDYLLQDTELLEKKEWVSADWSKTLEDMVLYLKKNYKKKEFKPVLPVYNGEVKIG